MALITKLNESVGNEDLFRLGEIAITISAPSSVAAENKIVVGKSYGGQSVRCGTNGLLYDDSTHTGEGVKNKTFNTNSGTAFYDDSTEKLFVSPNDGISTLEFADFSGASGEAVADRNHRISIGDANKLKYMVALTNLSLCGAEWDGDVADLFLAPAIIRFRCSTMREATASEFAVKQSMKLLDIRYSPNVTGNVTAFANMTSLERLLLGGSNITGTAADIKAAMEANGRHTGTMQFEDRYFVSSTITFE